MLWLENISAVRLRDEMPGPYYGAKTSGRPVPTRSSESTESRIQSIELYSLLRRRRNARIKRQGRSKIEHGVHMARRRWQVDVTFYFYVISRTEAAARNLH